MKFDDYERDYYIRYAEFAETIAQKAIQASDLPRPQSIQHRAKTPNSLKARLEENDKFGSDNIENERRDLAGVRLIFYTNTDVDRLLNSRLIAENFEIERSCHSSAWLSHNRDTDDLVAQSHSAQNIVNWPSRMA